MKKILGLVLAGGAAAMAVANPLEFPGYEQQLVEAEVAIVPVALAPFVLSLLVGSDGMNR